jgi:hypothetical protein
VSQDPWRVFSLKATTETYNSEEKLGNNPHVEEVSQWNSIESASRFTIDFSNPFKRSTLFE